MSQASLFYTGSSGNVIADIYDSCYVSYGRLFFVSHNIRKYCCDDSRGVHYGFVGGGNTPAIVEGSRGDF